MLEKTLESCLVCKEIQPVHPKENQSWIFIGRTDAEAETLILWPPDVKNWLIGNAGKDWRQEEKGTTEDEMVWWHQWLNGHEFQSTLGVGNGQGGLACCSPWGCKESDMTEWLNWTELIAGSQCYNSFTHHAFEIHHLVQSLQPPSVVGTGNSPILQIRKVRLWSLSNFRCIISMWRLKSRSSCFLISSSSIIKEAWGSLLRAFPA